MGLNTKLELFSIMYYVLGSFLELQVLLWLRDCLLERQDYKALDLIKKKVVGVVIFEFSLIQESSRMKEMRTIHTAIFQKTGNI